MAPFIIILLFRLAIVRISLRGLDTRVMFLYNMYGREVGLSEITLKSGFFWLRIVAIDGLVNILNVH